MYVEKLTTVGNIKWSLNPGLGALTAKGGTGMSDILDPLSTYLPLVAAWFSSSDLTLSKNKKFQFYSKILALISVHKPPECLQISSLEFKPGPDPGMGRSGLPPPPFDS